MHIKRFESQDMTRALRRIRDELGPDALILETRQIAGGRVEVLAAVPHPDVPEGSLLEDSDLGREAPATDAQESGRDLASLPPQELAALARRTFLQRDTSIGTAPTARRPESGSAISGLQRDPRIAETARRSERLPLGPIEVRGDVEAEEDFEASQVRTEATRRRASSSSVPSTPKASFDSDLLDLRSRIELLGRLARSDHYSQLDPQVRELYLDLVEADLDGTLALELITRFQDLAQPGGGLPELRSLLWEQLNRLVQVGGAVTEASNSRVLAFVGPTGVGKTTTLAKIAGNIAYTLGRRVGLLSLDNYRIFGADHLRAYAELMGLPFEAVTEVEAVRPALDSMRRDNDFVLLDTSGRSPSDSSGIEELGRLLGADPAMEIHLVLAANSRVRDLAHALEKFSALPLRHLVFTKVDEARVGAGLFTIALKANRSVAYLGTGQEVPDDLKIPAPPDLLAGLSELFKAPESGAPSHTSLQARAASPSRRPARPFGDVSGGAHV